MGIILSGKHGEANGKILNLNRFWEIYFSVNNKGSKYWLIFLGTFKFDGFFLKVIYQVMKSNIYKKSEQFTLG